MAGTRSAKKVVLFAMPRLALEDLFSGATPNLDRLVREGAVAATTVRTVAVRPSTVEAYATLGAGARVRARGAADDAFVADEKVGLFTASQLAELRTGKAVDGSLVVIGMAATIRLNEGRFLGTAPGALGDALQAARKRTAVVGNADTGLVDVDKAAVAHRPAAIAVADGSGSVDLGEVSPNLLRTDLTYPFGVRLAAGRFLSAAREAIGAADVVVLDPGELERVFAIEATTTESRFDTLRVRALRDTDAILGGVVRALPADALLVVTAVRPPGTAELTPTVLWGDGVRHGLAVSPSTRRLGLVALTDLAPTVLDALGIDIPEGMIGHPLRYHPVEGAPDMQVLEDQNDAAVYRDRIYLPLTKGFVVFQGFAYAAIVMLFAARRATGPARPWIERLLLGIAAWPLVTFVFRMIPHAWVLGPFAGLVMIGIDAALVALARRAPRHPLSALSRLLFASTALLVVDLGTGADLQQSSVLGYSPLAAARFTGMGNAAFAVLAASTILWACIHVHASPDREGALLRAGTVCAVVVIVDGAPMLGSDVGGVLTLVPVFALLLFRLSDRRVRARTLAWIAVATILAIGAAVGVDLLRPADSRTHLARFVTDLFEPSGRDTFGATIGRKLSANVRLLTRSFWMWMIPITAGVLVYVLVFRRGWEREFRAPRVRSAIVVTVLCGLLGFALNDSGVMVMALVSTYLTTFILTMSLLERTAGDGAASARRAGEYVEAT